MDNFCAIFAVLPSLNKADPEIMEEGPHGWVDRQVTEVFAPLIEQARGGGIPTFLVTHGTINGSMTESNWALVSPDHEFSDSQLFASNADVIMLGHIHKHQTWERHDQSMAYPGSLARLVHGDHEEKGWLLWTVDDGISFEFISSPTRKLLEIDFDGPPKMEELEELAGEAGPDDAVRIRWNVDYEYAHTVDRKAMQALFSHCDSLNLEGSINPMQSIRTAGIATAANLEEKLRYFASTTGDEAHVEDWAARLAMLQSNDIDGVIKKLLEVGE